MAVTPTPWPLSRSVRRGVAGHGQEGESKVPQMLPLYLSLHINLGGSCQPVWLLAPRVCMVSSELSTIWALGQALCGVLVEAPPLNSVPGKPPRAWGLWNPWPQPPHQVSWT